MIESKQLWHTIDQVIIYRKLWRHNSWLLPCYINCRLADVGFIFIKVTCHHIGERLSPVMPRFQRRVGDTYQPDNKEQQQPKADVFKKGFYVFIELKRHFAICLYEDIVCSRGNTIINYLNIDKIRLKEWLLPNSYFSICFNFGGLPILSGKHN